MINLEQINQEAVNHTLSPTTWREHRNHRTESQAVKKALIASGYTNVKVGHGSGTAWGWLHIKCDAKPGQSFQEKDSAVIRIAKEVTGRHGDYDGNINVN